MIPTTRPEDVLRSSPTLSRTSSSSSLIVSAQWTPLACIRGAVIYSKCIFSPSNVVDDLVLHVVAEEAGGAQRYDDRIIRARLAQAFGRLIRTREDSGHFVMLSPAFPSRLLSAFPEGTPVTRLTLEEALQRVAKGVVSPEQMAAETQPQ